MVHPTWATSTHKLSVLYYYTIQQNEGIQLTATPLHFLFALSQSLSHNHRDCFYNATIQYTFVLQCFPFTEELPWENTTSNLIPWDHKMLANKHPPKNSFRGFALETSRGDDVPPHSPTRMII